MGYCKDCMYFSRSYEEKRLFQPTLYGCTLFNKYVTENGSCSRFEPNTYQSGSGNSNGCFLTSACVEYLGKADDCEELTALRKFRDNYMKSTEEGKKLVEEYYAVAPQIVERINSSNKKDTYYQYVNEVINKCLNLLDRNEYERTLNEYKFMVQNLRKEFSL